MLGRGKSVRSTAAPLPPRLQFFNNATLLSLDMILRTPDTARVPGRRKVYIVADEPTLDYPTVRAIQGSGGDGGIVTPIMWSAPDPSG